MVKGLPVDTTNESCQNIFAQYGNVTSAKVLPVAFGKTAAAAFVIMATVDEAKWIVENVNGNVPQGLSTAIEIIFATPREERNGGKGGKGKGKDSWGGDSWGGMGMMQSWKGGGDSWGGGAWGGKGGKDGGKGGGCGYGSWGGGSKGGGGFGGGGFDGGFGGGKGGKDGGKGGKGKGPYW